MKKEWIRDYATGAFLRYAGLGCPTREDYEGRLYRAVCCGREREDPQTLLQDAERAMRERAAVLADIDAVNDVLQTLERGGRGEICAALHAVYFVHGGYFSTRGELVSRVRRFAADLPADERTVYRWLKHARHLFAVKRGLTAE